jgi:hypothetical protein
MLFISFLFPAAVKNTKMAEKSTNFEKCLKRPECSVKNTHFKDFRTNGIEDLSKHYLDCGDSVINSISLIKHRQAKNRLHYEYTCCPFNFRRYYEKSTVFTNLYNIENIKFHNISCGHDQYLFSTLKIQISADEFRYIYNCLESPVKLICSQVFETRIINFTQIQDFVQFEGLQCPQYMGFSWIKLMSSNEGYKYMFQCCKQKFKKYDNPTIKYFEPRDENNKYDYDY